MTASMTIRCPAGKFGGQCTLDAGHTGPHYQTSDDGDLRTGDVLIWRTREAPRDRLLRAQQILHEVVDILDDRGDNDLAERLAAAEITLADALTSYPLERS